MALRLISSYCVSFLLHSEYLFLLGELPPQIYTTFHYRVKTDKINDCESAMLLMWNIIQLCNVLGISWEFFDHQATAWPLKMKPPWYTHVAVQCHMPEWFCWTAYWQIQITWTAHWCWLLWELAKWSSRLIPVKQLIRHWCVACLLSCFSSAKASTSWMLHVQIMAH